MSLEETAVIKARNYADIAKLSEPTVAEQFLAEPLSVIVETVTGLFIEGPKKFVVAGSHLVQAALKGHMLEQWAREFNDLRSKGAIADNFEQTKYGFQTWAELISIIDEDRPDADRLEALKAMFLAVNRINSTDGEKIAAYHLWIITKQLGSGELLLLRTANQYHEATYPDVHMWRDAMGKFLGHGISPLVELHEKKLVEFGLISGPPSFAAVAVRGRVTTLGARLCSNIQNYELLVG